MSETVEIIDGLLNHIVARTGIYEDNLTDAIERILDNRDWLFTLCGEHKKELTAWVKASACAKPEHLEAYTKVQTDTILALQEKVRRLEGEKADLAVYNKVLIKSGYLPERIKEDAQSKMNNARQAREGTKT